MADKHTLTIELNLEQQRRLENRAHQRGYNTPADYVRALITADAIDPDQAYFWTDEWQAAEREADEDIAAGRVESFDSMEEFLADLMDDDD